MERYLELYQKNPLFQGIREEELGSLLECLQARQSAYPKGSLILAAGDVSTRLGIVLSGHVHVVNEDLLGNRSILNSVGPGQFFCDAFSCTREQRLPVSVVAQTDCTVLMIETDLILHTCAHACSQHRLLSENLIHILAEKYTALSQKVVHLSGRTTRRKLISYFSEQSRMAQGKAFAIPFNQQELADYLFIERSGLSTEMNRLKKEGILHSRDGMFTLNAGMADRPDPVSGM